MTRLTLNENSLFVRYSFLTLLCVYFTSANPVPCVLTSRQRLDLKDVNGTFYVLNATDTTSGTYQKAAVASNSNQCAKIGAKILQKGGSAVDGAIATLLCDGVVSIQGMGIGGGFLMTIWNATEKKAYFLNAREYAPSAAYERIFTPANKDDAKFGGKAIAVPGEIAGYWAAHQRFGKLPWKDLFEDTIKICQEGSDVSRYVANDMIKAKDDINKPEFAALKKLIKHPNSCNASDLFDYGHKINRSALAETLRKISEHGAEIFYKGEIADNLVRDIQAAGGVVTKADFENYAVIWKEPVSTTVRGKTLYSAPTPGSGAILAFMLNVLDPLIPENNPPEEKIMYQRIVETFKWGYARRNELGDFYEREEYASRKTKDDCRVNPEQEEQLRRVGNYSFVERGEKKWDKDCLMSVALKTLLSKEYADQVRSLIEDDHTYDYDHYNVTAKGEIDLGTAHTSVLAEDGSAVSVTSTINHLFGSLVYSESTGIILNNEMDDYSYPGIRNGFDMEPSEFNFVRNETNKTLRPMSSMSPTIILNEDQTVRLVIGSAGGTKITTGVCLGIIRNLFLGKDIKEALDAPRIHHNLWPMAVQTEPGFNPEVLNYLQSINHNTTGWLIMQNTIAAIAVNKEKQIRASGDYRREGGTGGY